MFKLIRITTIPGSLKGLLTDQLKYMNSFYEVVGVAGPGDKLQEVAEREGVRTHAIDMAREVSPARDLKSLLTMIAFLKKEKPAIVHTHTPKAGFIGMLAAKVTGVPIRLHTVAGMPLMEAKGTKKKILLAVEKLTYACATKVYPNSYGLEKYILDEKLVSADKVNVIGKGSSNGIDLNFFDPEKIDLKEFLAQNPELEPLTHHGCFNYIFIGRLVRDKGINELISAFVKVAAQLPQSNLILLGDYETALDPLSPKTLEIIKTHTQIYYRGYQTNIRPYLKLSHALVFPSYREGLPNVPMQANAFNLPVICTRIIGCADVVEDGLNGLLVEPKSDTELYDAMIRLQSDTALYSKLQTNARNVIRSKYERSFVFSQIRQEYEIALQKTYNLTSK